MLSLGGTKGGTSSQTCTIAPSALATILDHHLRRPTNSDGSDQDRVFGTLLGSILPNAVVHVSSTLGTPYRVTEENDIKIDLEDLESGLAARSAAGAQIVGWYSTAPALNTYTPLIHERYASAAPNPASIVHLTVDPVSFRFVAYSAQNHLGRPNAVFAPITTELKLEAAERAGFDLLVAQPPSTALTPPTPLAHLASLLSSLSQQLDSTIAYVNKAVDDPASAEARNAQLSAALAKGLEGVAVMNDKESRDQWDEESENHIADVLLLSYLANLAKLQMELAGRLSLLPEKERSLFDRAGGAASVGQKA